MIGMIPLFSEGFPFSDLHFNFLPVVNDLP